MSTMAQAGPVFKITAANVYKLTGASNEGENGGTLVHIVNDNSFVGSITIQGQSRQIDIAGAADNLQAIPYRAFALNGAAGTLGYITTAITTSSVIFIPSGGMTPALDVTSYTSGSCSVYVTPIPGSCAL